MKKEIKEIWKITRLPVLLASLCCLSPVILVTLGIATASFAGGLADIWYGDFKWVFRGIGFLALGISIYTFLTRQKGICTIDDVKKRKTEVINYLALALIGGVLLYLFFLYVVVHYLGVWLGLWL